jgi:hypothetical protein
MFVHSFLMRCHLYLNPPWSLRGTPRSFCGLLRRQAAGKGDLIDFVLLSFPIPRLSGSAFKVQGWRHQNSVRQRVLVIITASTPSHPTGDRDQFRTWRKKFISGNRL